VAVTLLSFLAGAGEGYENTLSAFKHAVGLGTEMLELDVHLTEDKQVVVSHDHNLLRSTGFDKDISQVKFSELPVIKEQLSLDFDPGDYNHLFFAFFPNAQDFPLLASIFPSR